MDVSQFQQLKDEFLLEIKNIVSMHEIPAELVINVATHLGSTIPPCTLHSLIIDPVPDSTAGNH